MLKIDQNITYICNDNTLHKAVNQFELDTTILSDVTPNEDHSSIRKVGENCVQICLEEQGPTKTVIRHNNNATNGVFF